MGNRETYTVDEVASLLGISRGVAYNQVNEGAIPSIRLGKRLIIPKNQFHTWLNGGTE